MERISQVASTTSMHNKRKQDSLPLPLKRNAYFLPMAHSQGHLQAAFGEKRISMALGGVQMDSIWKNALWQQFGAAIDMLENAPLGLSGRARERAPLGRTNVPPSVGMRRNMRSN